MHRPKIYHRYHLKVKLHAKRIEFDHNQQLIDTSACLPIEISFYIQRAVATAYKFSKLASVSPNPFAHE